MLQPELLEQVHRLRFDDSALEAAFFAERCERDARSTRRVALTLGAVAGILGLIIVGMSRRLEMRLPVAWVVVRFGLVVPSTLLLWFLAGRAWGKARLQGLLCACLVVTGGAYAFEWAMEWTPAMPIRTLWLVPALMLWASMMTLPLTARMAGFATALSFVAAEVSMIVFVPPLSGPMLVSMAVAFALTTWALVLIARWRERDWRMMFAVRREAEQLAEKLRAQNDTLQQLIAQRNEFVAGVLHDLRSPLTALQLSTELLRTDDGIPSGSRAETLDGIARAGQRVASFANRFLEQRSLERAATTFTLTPVECDTMVEEAVATARVNASKKGQRITVTIAAPHQRIVADELLFDRALGNLLDNALKYSPPATTIAVHIATDPTESGRVRVAVIDTGPGLSMAEQAQVFRPYVRLDKKPTGDEPSTGLGLSLVKHCIEGMGGAVGCESALGHGATFWLALRRAGPSV